MKVSGQLQVATGSLKTERVPSPLYPHPPAASTAQGTVCTQSSVRILWRREKLFCPRQHSYGDSPVALLQFHQSYVRCL